MKLLIILLLSLLFNFSYSQEIEITARVIDKETKKPIKNANVIVFGTTRGTITNALGFFKLALAPSERRLMISHVSYKTEPINVPDNVSSFTIPLTATVYQLAEIDLKQYPNNFKNEDAVPSELNLKKQSKDSMTIVESLAFFPYKDGSKTFSEFFGNAFQFPEKELREKQEGRLFLEFTIDKNGDYKFARCLMIDSLNGVCKECRRVLTTLPKWIPGQQRGEEMDLKFVVPVYYGLNNYWKMELRKKKKE